MMAWGTKRWEDSLFTERGRWIFELLLTPLLVISWIYGLIVWVKVQCYRKGLLKRRPLPCKVISVGNMTLGGTGKTPMVICLAKALQRKGVKVGVLSRGYKGTRERGGGVLSDGEHIYLTPHEAGDEPFMLARMLPGVPVLVGKDRCKMGLCAHERFGVDVLILDDGFQYLGLKRDLDIVLVDARSGFGNGHLFPRGPLREPLGGLRRASLLVISKTESSQSPPMIEKILCDVAPEVALYHSRYKPLCLLEATSRKVFPPQFVHGKRVLAFAGIADPGYFVHLLKELGAEVVKEFHFPDHYHYGTNDLRMLGEHTDKAELAVTTEKDYVKLQGIPLEDFRVFVLCIAQEILEGKMFSQTVLSAII